MPVDVGTAAPVDIGTATTSFVGDPRGDGAGDGASADSPAREAAGDRSGPVGSTDASGAGGTDDGTDWALLLAGVVGGLALVCLLPAVVLHKRRCRRGDAELAQPANGAQALASRERFATPQTTLNPTHTPTKARPPSSDSNANEAFDRTTEALYAAGDPLPRDSVAYLEPSSEHAAAYVS